MTILPELRRVLVVSPRFPPLNSADLHRVRISLPYFKQFGWEPHVLTVRVEPGDGLLDDALLQTIPDDVPIHRVDALSLRRAALLGFRDVGLRAHWALYRRGLALLRQQKFDVVYFSTTAFVSTTLGPLWQRLTGVPYVVDIHDPWRGARHFQSRLADIPGGLCKFTLKYLFLGLLERWVMGSVAHVISVSDGYFADLNARFPRLGADRFTVLPFGASDLDFQLLSRMQVTQRFFDPGDGLIHWVYTGRSSMDMVFALRLLFCALANNRQRNPSHWERVRLHFVGTSYSPGTSGTKTVAPVAAEFGLEHVVVEYPQRVPYFEALQLLTESHGILMISSDDPFYSASKVYPLILARRPLLGLVHRESMVADIMTKCQAGFLVRFDPANPMEHFVAEAELSLDRFLNASMSGSPVKTNWEAFMPYTAREMTRRQCLVLDQVINEGTVELQSDE
ncbi:MAG: glycosyltransferase [Magnetococcales bacterium]|nr:glycosyltransferase [Magnetococcales bacterium]MBF0321326.1 glycosyltransferase [Magnetococcales bacterium]